MSLPERKTSRLRWGRVSIPGANYFVTACTKNREPVLGQPSTAQRVLRVLTQLHETEDVIVLAATVMPDHVHLVFTLGARLSIGQTIAKFKSLVREQGQARWRWQEDSFEHRLRSDESPNDYAFYVFMNPYSAGLIGITETWPWWHAPNPTDFEFNSGLVDGLPPKEWLSQRIALRPRLFLS